MSGNEKLTKGQLEASFTRAMIQFEKEYFGRGPLDARTFIIRDLMLIRLQGILTPAESKLAESEDGRVLVKETRRQLFEQSRPLLEEMVKQITGVNMISLHTDMSTRTGERMVVFTLDQDLEKKFR